MPTERSYQSGVTLSIGMLSCIGNLYTLKTDNDEKVKSVCPTCDEPHQFMSQRMICNEDGAHGPFEYADCHWGQMDGDKSITKVDKAEIEEARKSKLPEKELELRVYRRDDVERHTFPTGNSYAFRPDGSSKLYGVLVDVLNARPDLCFVAMANLKNRDHIVMVDVELGNQLVVRDMIWPEDMKPQPHIEYEYPDNFKAQAVMLLDASLEDFVPADYTKAARERLATVIAEARAAEGTTTKATSRKKKAPATKDDSALADALAASLAAAKKKPAQKKAS